MTLNPNSICLTLCCAALITMSTLRDSSADEPGIEHRSSIHSVSTSSNDSNREATDHAEATASKNIPPTSRRKAELEEVLHFAQTAYARINDEIDDYTCVLYKREMVNGQVSSWQSMTAKIRHEKKEAAEVRVPFSVYLRFLKPEKFTGRAVLYVQNQNNGDLIGRRGGRRNPNMTVQLIPTGPMAMEGNRYPITEIGFQNLAKRLIEVMEQELEYRDGDVEIFENARVGDRNCTHFRLTHHKRRPNLTYYMAEVSVDNELGIPIRYGAYDFPQHEGGNPQLLEQYVYADIHVNVGLTDEDFSHENPAYGFQLFDKSEERQP